MAKDWISFFKLTGDPFSTTPLQTKDDFKYLFVKTDDITNQIDPLIEYFEQSAPFIRVIAAPRGSGKSTILHYMAHALRNKNILVCFVSHQPAILKGERDPAFGIGNDTVSKIVCELTEKLIETEKGQDKSNLIQLLDGLGLTVSGNVLDVRSITSFSYGTNRKRLESLLKYFKNRKIRGFLAIDNFDKLDEERAIGFLKSNFSQPLFEELQAAGISIAIAASLEWTQKIGEKDLSYLGEPIILNPLNPIEASTLIQKRIASKSIGEPEKIFDDRAMTRITIREEGIARYVLETCRLCMIKAAERNIRRIDENFVQEVLRSHERSAGKYYRAIKSDPVALGGFLLLSSIARETDPDSFRTLLYGLVDVMEGREPSNDVVEQLRRYKLLYLSEKPLEPEQLKNCLASEIKKLLDTIARRYPLSSFMEWLSAGEPVFLFIPTFEEKKTDSTIEEQFNLVLPAFKREEVRLLLRNAYTSYKAWNQQIEQGDFNTAQILSDIWASLWGLAVCAYYSSKVMKEKIFEPPRPSYEEIESFLLNHDETRRIVPDFAVIHQYYIFAEREVPIDPSLIENLYPRIMNAISSLLELCMMSLPYLRELGIPLPSFKVRDAEQLDNKLMPYLKTDDRYIYVFLDDSSPSEFLILSWLFKNYVYSLFFGKEQFERELDLDLYEIRSKLPYKLPDFIHKQLHTQGLSDGKLLRYYNSLEFCSSLFKLAKNHITYLKIYAPKITVNIALTTEKDQIVGSVYFSDPKYGSKINLSDSHMAFYETEIIKSKPKLFISYSHEDEAFVKKLVQDLRKEGIDLWIDFQKMNVGDSIVEKINEAIESNDYLAVVLSPASVNSEWVRRELSAGLMKELKNRSVFVLPILARKCKVPPLLSDKVYANFAENYQKGLHELLAKLKADLK
jgi:Cdc6-like AAA superfamily ATPase